RISRGPRPEEKIFHVPGDRFLRFLLPRHETVLIENHLLPVFPHLPRLGGHALIDALSKLAGPWRGIARGQILLELHAVHDAPTGISHRTIGVGCCAIVHERHVTSTFLGREIARTKHRFTHPGTSSVRLRVTSGGHPNTRAAVSA